MNVLVWKETVPVESVDKPVAHGIIFMFIQLLVCLTFISCCTLQCPPLNPHVALLIPASIIYPMCCDKPITSHYILVQPISCGDKQYYDVSSGYLSLLYTPWFYPYLFANGLSCLHTYDYLCITIILWFVTLYNHYTTTTWLVLHWPSLVYIEACNISIMIMILLPLVCFIPMLFTTMLQLPYSYSCNDNDGFRYYELLLLQYRKWMEVAHPWPAWDVTLKTRRLSTVGGQ